MQEELHISPNYSSNIIHLNESWEINRWCEELNLRADELIEIVKKVGPALVDIREYLARQSLRRESPY